MKGWEGGGGVVTWGRSNGLLFSKRCSDSAAIEGDVRGWMKKRCMDGEGESRGPALDDPIGHFYWTARWGPTSTGRLPSAINNKH